jgi:haloacid dehalogenase-like hydrolase
LNVFFDVDATILAEDGTLRPHTHEVFEQLISDGHVVYIWSGVGLRTAEVHAFGLESLVTGIYVKPLFEFVAGLVKNGIPVKPDFVIDDYPTIVDHYGGLRIKAYEIADEFDTELLAVPELVAAMARTRSAATESASG